MKLRFHENTMRLRLSQSEVAQLAATGSVDERIEFVSDQTLSYELESADRDDVVALFENNCIRVVLPKATVKQWAASDEIGIEGECGPLRVLIEKDFQCLHPDAPQSEDAFPNPLVAE
jgi:hypothetical protein